MEEVRKTVVLLEKDMDEEGREEIADGREEKGTSVLEKKVDEGRSEEMVDMSTM